MNTQQEAPVRPEPATVGSALRQARSLLESATEAVRPQLSGQDLVPAQGPAILVFNHVLPVDRLGLRFGGRTVHFVTDGASSVLRRPAASRTEQVRAARAVLDRGELLGLFPEGGRSPDGRLYRGDVAVACLALDAQVSAPVIPVAVLTERSLLGRLVAPELVVGQPVELSRFAQVGDDEQALRAATDLVMYALMELTGQTYMDVPVARRREELAQERRVNSAAARAQTKAARAREQAAAQQRIADRQAEAAELAQIQAEAARAAQEHARQAAEREAQRRRVRATRQPTVQDAARRDLARPIPTVPFDVDPSEVTGRMERIE
ncbi:MULTISPECIES: lysophospholipid acyltransferase family protein [unclassified Luteococcus]|uniref:lysophospholipid acyltransferase family protein n=1 Tax=unclassified Luteococcus TaxID=2639923 RepID=UPI00313B930E